MLNIETPLPTRQVAILSRTTNKPKLIRSYGNNRHGPTLRNLAIPKAADITDKANENRTSQCSVFKVASSPRKIMHRRRCTYETRILIGRNIGSGSHIFCPFKGLK